MKELRGHSIPAVVSAEAAAPLARVSLRRPMLQNIERRLTQLRLPHLAAYRSYLERNEAEWPVLDELCRVSISRFFRDRAAFEYLELAVLPELSRMIFDLDALSRRRCWPIRTRRGRI